MKPRDTRSVEDLIQACNAGEKPKYLFFWGHTASTPGKVGKECLSQWYYAPFIIAGIKYPTAEHYMMAMKAQLFRDMNSLEKIIKAASPSIAKALGREVAGFNEEKWSSNAFNIVVEGNFGKFSQNKIAMEYLLGTGSRVLVEASPNDKIWGIGLSQDNPFAEQPVKWKGQNKLGFSLMEVREKLKSA